MSSAITRVKSNANHYDGSASSYSANTNPTVWEDVCLEFDTDEGDIQRDFLQKEKDTKDDTFNHDPLNIIPPMVYKSRLFGTQEEGIAVDLDESPANTNSYDETNINRGKKWKKKLKIFGGKRGKPGNRKGRNATQTRMKRTLTQAFKHMEHNRGADDASVQIDSKIDFSSKEFDPILFIKKLHFDTSYSNLVNGSKYVSEKSGVSRTSALKSLVNEKFDDFVECRSAIDAIQEVLHHHSINCFSGSCENSADGNTTVGTSNPTSYNSSSSTASNVVSEEVNVHKLAVEILVDNATFSSATLLDPLNGVRKKVHDLKTVLQILKRFDFIFQLPSILETNIQSKDFIKLVLNYKKAKQYISLFKHSIEVGNNNTSSSKDDDATTAGYVEVIENAIHQGESVISVFVETIYQKLQDVHIPLDEQERNIEVLCEIRDNSEGSEGVHAIWILLWNRYHHILTLLHECRQSFDVNYRDIAAGDDTSTTRSNNDGDTVKIAEASYRFINILSEIMIYFLPDFWLISQYAMKLLWGKYVLQRRGTRLSTIRQALRSSAGVANNITPTNASVFDGSNSIGSLPEGVGFREPLVDNIYGMLSKLGEVYVKHAQHGLKCIQSISTTISSTTLSSSSSSSSSLIRSSVSSYLRRSTIRSSVSSYLRRSTCDVLACYWKVHHIGDVVEPHRDRFHSTEVKEKERGNNNNNNIINLDGDAVAGGSQNTAVESAGSSLWDTSSAIDTTASDSITEVSWRMDETSGYETSDSLPETTNLHHNNSLNGNRLFVNCISATGSRLQKYINKRGIYVKFKFQSQAMKSKIHQKFFDSDANHHTAAVWNEPFVFLLDRIGSNLHRCVLNVTLRSKHMLQKEIIAKADIPLTNFISGGLEDTFFALYDRLGVTQVGTIRLSVRMVTDNNLDNNNSVSSNNNNTMRAGNRINSSVTSASSGGGGIDSPSLSSSHKDRSDSLDYNHEFLAATFNSQNTSTPSSAYEASSITSPSRRNTGARQHTKEGMSALLLLDEPLFYRHKTIESNRHKRHLNATTQNFDETNNKNNNYSSLSHRNTRTNTIASIIPSEILSATKLVVVGKSQLAETVFELCRETSEMYIKHRSDYTKDQIRKLYDSEDWKIISNNPVLGGDMYRKRTLTLLRERRRKDNNNNSNNNNNTDSSMNRLTSLPHNIETILKELLSDLAVMKVNAAWFLKLVQREIFACVSVVLELFQSFYTNKSNDKKSHQYEYSHVGNKKFITLLSNCMYIRKETLPLVSTIYNTIFISSIRFDNTLLQQCISKFMDMEHSFLKSYISMKQTEVERIVEMEIDSQNYASNSSRVNSGDNHRSVFLARIFIEFSSIHHDIYSILGPQTYLIPQVEEIPILRVTIATLVHVLFSKLYHVIDITNIMTTINNCGAIALQGELSILSEVFGKLIMQFPKNRFYNTTNVLDNDDYSHSMTSTDSIYSKIKEHILINSSEYKNNTSSNEPKIEQFISDTRVNYKMFAEIFQFNI